MRSFSRRNLLGKSGIVSIGAIPGIRSFGQANVGYHSTLYDELKLMNNDGLDPEFNHAVITAAVDSAVSSGASYAEARITLTQRMQLLGSPIPYRVESMGIAVRVLVNGYWGMACSPVINRAEGTRLGAAAVSQAKVNFIDGPFATHLSEADRSSGEWRMPVREDPFKISFDEMLDYFEGLRMFIGRIKHVAQAQTSADFFKQQKLFGSSTGQLITQTIYNSSGSVGGVVAYKGSQAPTTLNTLTPAGKGFELFRDQDLRAQMIEAVEETKRDIELPLHPVEVGKFPLLLHPGAVASVVNPTIGAATEIDRALGLEANARGTSYLLDPVSMRGSFKIGGPLLSITAERSATGSAATVKWDDEGIEPRGFEVVSKGIFQEFQSNREGAGWLQNNSGNKSAAVRSTGCMVAPDAMAAPLVYPANLTVVSENTSISADELRKDINDGMEITFMGVDIDHQCISGLGRGAAYEIKKGIRTARIPNAGILFRTSELWENLGAVGGDNSSQTYGVSTFKGQPASSSNYSISAPAMLFKDVSFIDVTRKA